MGRDLEKGDFIILSESLPLLKNCVLTIEKVGRENLQCEIRYSDNATMIGNKVEDIPISNVVSHGKIKWLKKIGINIKMKTFIRQDSDEYEARIIFFYKEGGGNLLFMTTPKDQSRGFSGCNYKGFYPQNIKMNHFFSEKSMYIFNKMTLEGRKKRQVNIKKEINGNKKYKEFFDNVEEFVNKMTDEQLKKFVG